MKNADINELMSVDLEKLEMPELPDQVIDAHQLPMDISQDVWRFNDPVTDAIFDFSRTGITNKWLIYSVKRHLIFCIQRVSPRECWNTVRLNFLYLSKCQSWSRLCTANSIEAHSQALTRVMSEVVELLRREGTLYNFARIRAWYRWCVDYLPEFGFDPDESYKLELIRVPGNEKGVAVRTDDLDGGPLNDTELILLRKALQADRSILPIHIQQRSALWLSLVYGRNPANFVQLRVEDLKKIIDSESDELWELNIPRIKKRQRPRSDFKSEYVTQLLADIVNELIQFGHDEDSSLGPNRPIFVRKSPRVGLLDGPMAEWAWHLTTNEFTGLIRDAVERYGIVSPRTGEALAISTRRLRYTFATNRVREGISAIDLADALDHTDLQNVRVYFDAKSTVVERLDRAAATEIAPKLKLFTGQIVPTARDAVNGTDPAKRIRVATELIAQDHQVNDLGVCGKKEFCRLFPPYSCYPCDRFQPFADSLEVHERVLDFLIDRRERLRVDPLESTRIAVQLDEVIYACAEVVEGLKPGGI
ncbi:MAG: tyrosine-type recombinase/integrase [Hylemonella sp.]